MNELFSGIAHVSIQGERVLRFLNCTDDHAIYEVIGFEEAPIIMVDFRRNGRIAIRELLETGDLQAFAPKFNFPADIRITSDANQSVIVELRDTDTMPSFVLWVAIGLGNSMPVYDYHYENIRPLAEDSRFALVAVYQISSPSPAASRSDLAFATSSLSSMT